MKHPELLKGPNISLSLPIKEDFEDLSLWNDPVFREYGSKPSFVLVEDPETRLKEARNRWRRGEPYFTVTENDKFIGFLSFQRFVDVWEMALSLLRERGKGYGKEAVMLGLTWAFAVQGLPTVVLLVTTTNTRAIRTYRSAGMEEKCRLPKLLKYANRWEDMLLFTTEREKWLEKHREFVKDVLKRSGFDSKHILGDFS